MLFFMWLLWYFPSLFHFSHRGLSPRWRWLKVVGLAVVALAEATNDDVVTIPSMFVSLKRLGMRSEGACSYLWHCNTQVLVTIVTSMKSFTDLRSFGVTFEGVLG